MVNKVMADYILSYWFFVFIMILITLNALYVFMTQFEKQITVKEKHTYGSKGSKNNQRISDTDGNIYSVINSIYILHFTSAELFNQLEEGKTYNVNGYGMRIPFLGMFPNITGISIKK